MDSPAESLPARVTVVCPECGRSITTGQSGNSTRCPKVRGGCGATVYVPAGTTRPPVTLLCKHCHHLWETRSAAGNMARCPKCKAPRRVPASIRREPQYAPAPERRAPLQIPERPARETRPRRPATPRSEPARTPRKLPGRRPDPVGLPTLATLLQGLTHGAAARQAPPTAPPTRPPAPAPRPAPADPGPSQWPRPGATAYRSAPPVGRPARPGRVTPPGPDTLREHHRRDSVTQLVTSMGGPLRIAFDTPHGMCEVMDVTQPRDRQRCRGAASRAVVFWSHLSQEVHAYACPAHAVALAAATDQHPAIAATVVGLNI